jgi:asparagine synthase (glutamine-hydrolysing)
MCGIVGALSFKSSNFKVTATYINHMRDTMIHRGPDGCGTWISEDGKIGLGHRRLAIIDLSEKASQPMNSADGTLWITFNGEIYNHAEVRKELERLGYHQWKTDHSDTEVVLYAFKQWGIDCLHKFRGMFAMALWDVEKRELWLIRDRIGIKPLYYSVHHGRITFASEIKALLADHDQKRVVHEEAFYHYLSFLTTPAPQTLFDGIKKLPGGTWIRVRDDGEIQEHKYWDVWDYATPFVGISEDEIANRLLSELREAVKLRKVSDVPVGVFLSGGIDSSTNAALFSNHSSKKPVKTFTIGYDRQYSSYENEIEYARKMAESIHAEQHELLLNIDDLLNFLPEMVRLQDEPIADPVCVPVYYVSKLARENGVIVCQVGEGSDELFCGYPSWNTRLKLEYWSRLPIPTILKLQGLTALRAFGFGTSLHYEYLRRSATRKPIFWGSAEAFTETQKKRLLSKRLKNKFRDYSSWEVIDPIYKRFKEKAWEKTPLHWMTYLDLNIRLPELLLMRVDKMSMGVSLECRVPFLDHKFVELAMSIPSSLKTKKGILKYILKKAVRGLIPNELIDRRKQGFGVPIQEWVFDRLGETERRELEFFCQTTDFLDRNEAVRYLDKQNGLRSWFIFNFVLWWKEYIYEMPKTVSTCDAAKNPIAVSHAEGFPPIV